ncbi:MAG: hypothetical protein OSA24_09130 [Longimicrobiales bacterium]|nr:hypothetical protein [Longimicrobiales bacterium]
MNEEIETFAIKTLIVGAVAMSVIQFTHSRGVKGWTLIHEDIVGLYERASLYQNCLKDFSTSDSEPDARVRMLCSNEKMGW